MHHFVLRSVAATALLWLAASPADAQPAAVSPFARGQLNPNGRVKIYTIDLASGGIAALTRDGDWDDEQPRWSPDGQRIAFRSNRSGSYNLYVMDADGRNVRRLT